MPEVTIGSIPGAGGTQRLPLAQVLNLFCNGVEALAYAHEQGLLHRNLTPTSLQLAGTAGAHHLLLADATLPSLRDDGQILSDAAGYQVLTYAHPPEQIDGGGYDQRGEQFALGVMLYELCTGFQPFYAETLAAAYEHLVERKATVRPARELRPDLPEALNATILRCLRPAPAERFASVAELAYRRTPPSKSLQSHRHRRLGTPRSCHRCDAPFCFRAPR
ncbi:MAG: protein kinase [Nitrospiraceae bacterium]|nr:protein kinase [Nitrospiraceae bacterium]